jgi:2,3,4,5-tetrahydropyridine-2,6-dicarboxylate N-succinyltransferase
MYGVGVIAERTAWGWGVATVHDATQTVLDCWFPLVGLDATTMPAGARAELKELEGPDPARGVRREIVSCTTGLAAPPADAADVWLRLHLLSRCLVAPRGLDLSGIFGLLATVVWTSAGPCSPVGFEETRMALQARGALTVHGVDKFPRLTDYVIPDGVRIADAARVRLGAHLAPGTTVMHEGFVNYNAGTLGESMVEGRISSGVVVGAGSDVGGGASIMGTLSGGGTEVISVGRRCLIGANAGIGISLGDDCVVEAGCYVTAAAKLTVADGSVVKAATLSGRSNLLFRRNSVSGALEAVHRDRTGVALNPALHVND